MPPRFSTCFIIAPIEANTAPLRQALEARSIKWTDAAAVDPGDSVLGSIESAIKKSQFVCVVLPSERSHTNIFFEMGLARGLRRPMLLFVEKGTSLPFDLQNVAYVRTDLQDSEAVTFHLDTFLRHAGKSRRPVTQKAKSVQNLKTDVAWAVKALNELPIHRNINQALYFEDLVERLFRKAGGEVKRSPFHKDVGADMVVWLDSLQSSLRNPLVVEVKAWANASEHSLRVAENQLRSFIQRFHAGAGILVCNSLPPGSYKTRASQWPLVFVLSIRELITLVGEGRLAKELLQRRNEMVHGPR